MIARYWAGCALVIGALAASACGGGGYSSPTTPSPTTGGTSSSAAVTISIVTTGASNSFTPNPASQMQSGGTVAWRNNDGTTHRIVANDGSFDTGNIAPGATSQGVTPAAAGVNYHCSLHPSMIGSIGSQQGAPPPECTGPYCG